MLIITYKIHTRVRQPVSQPSSAYLLLHQLSYFKQFYKSKAYANVWTFQSPIQSNSNQTISYGFVMFACLHGSHIYWHHSTKSQKHSSHTISQNDVDSVVVLLLQVKLNKKNIKIIILSQTDDQTYTHTHTHPHVHKIWTSGQSKHIL